MAWIVQMFNKLRSRIHLKPVQILVGGFALVILVGSILLNLPIASRSGESVGYLNALFTSTSAVCVTGLVVVETGSTFSIFGQIVIIALIQFGGLGLMTCATFLFMILRKRITLKERLVMQEALNESGLQGLVKLTRSILIMTLTVELVGAALLSTRLVPYYGFAKGLYYSFFHSISAFCNAGFDVFGTGQSLMPFREDFMINFTIMALIIIGGLGFTVILEANNKRRFNRLSLQAKVVLSMSALLIVLGTLVIAVLEWNNPGTLGAEGMNPFEKIMAAMFQSVSARTAGYATVDQAALMPASKFFTVILMFIGASPASTGGGIKTTTIAVLILLVISVIRGKREIEIFGKSLSWGTITRAVTIALLALVLVVGVTMVISMIELGLGDPMVAHGGLEDVLFESVSAFGTVGLSANLTPFLGTVSRILLILTMFIGRLGPMTLALFFAIRQNTRKRAHIKRPEDRLMVG